MSHEWAARSRARLLSSFLYLSLFTSYITCADVNTSDYRLDNPGHAISGRMSDRLRLGGVLDLSMVVSLNSSRSLGPASVSGLSWLSSSM